MSKIEYGIFNQWTGKYEKFNSYEEASTRKIELVTKLLEEADQYFQISEFKTNEDNTVSQSICCTEGKPIRLKLEDTDIDTNWFHLPIKTGIWGDVTIQKAYPTLVDNVAFYQIPVFIGSSDAHWWMSNDPTYMNGINSVRTQYYNAKGRVLLGGLGLGLLPLLVANKPDVSEVIVVELNPNVIEAFRANGWDESKLTIVESSITDYKDTQGFDWICLDHVNQSNGLGLYNRYIEEIPQIIANVGMPKNFFDCFAWEELYTFWLEENKLVQSKGTFDTFKKPIFLPDYSEEELVYHMSFYDKESRGLINTAPDYHLSDMFKIIHSNRNK